MSMATNVGGYCFSREDVIGRGTYGTVYKGKQTDDPQVVVAIKVLHKHRLKRDLKLGNEISILKEVTSLRHENIVSLFQYQEVGDDVYLIMEYCDGGDLSAWMRHNVTVDEVAVRHFTRQLAKGIGALRTLDIVHRDLKPQNILVRQLGQPVNNVISASLIQLKIADFGESRFLLEGDMAGSFCGTVVYMAPEVLLGHPYDAKADLWSVGVILYQCFTGRLPFEEAYRRDCIHDLRSLYEQPLEPTPDYPNNISLEFLELLLGLLTRNPRDRIDFAEFLKHRFFRGLLLHPGVSCDGCGGAVAGVRYKCWECPNYNLCCECKNFGRHSSHDMVAISDPNDDGWKQFFRTS